MALLREGVVFCGIADAEATALAAGCFVPCAAAGSDICVDRCADNDRLRASRARYLGFRGGKRFMRLFISCSSIPSYAFAACAIAPHPGAASSYNLLTL
jgi:hypothetical protein